MPKSAKFLLLAFLSIVLAGAGFIAYTFYYYDAPGPLATETTVIFKRGEHFRAMTDDMAKAGVISQPLLFKAMGAISGEGWRFKTGEYRFPAGSSPHQIMDMIAEGKVVIHKLTVPEGWSVRDVIHLIKSEPVLEGDIAEEIPEGSLLPQTYFLTYGDKRQALVDKMQAGMSALLDELWQKRKNGLPFATPEQALTMASIVEKETGVNSERGRVAAVFINRLRKGMRLQSDPTVAYGLEQKTGKPLGHSLTLDDLKSDTPYNTYVIPGLPPAPIANPGKAALEATLNPPDTNELYFVATGAGGHHFAATLEEHNKNVQAYRDRVK